MLRCSLLGAVHPGIFERELKVMDTVKPENLRGAVALSHFFLRERVKPGDTVVDATCGNGRDTLLLARLVGPTGWVWAFDVQAEALEATRTLVAGEGLINRVEIVQAGHERLAEFVREPLAAVVFNLGYLPGGDKQQVTRPENTVTALQQAAGLLSPRGMITVCIYTGHPGAPEEGEAVENWAATLAPEQFNVWRSRQVNRPGTAPYLVLVEKIGR
jgi:ubiquinone/menaquinone biosynthesis C-methylase UbiE